MLSEHISGLARRAAARRSSSAHAVAAAGGDVDHHIGALLDHRQERHEAPRGPASAGRSSGSRACRCTIAAPASAAPIALCAISCGVIGRCGRHGRRVDRARHRAGDDHLVARASRVSGMTFYSPISSAAWRFWPASAIRRRSRQALRAPRPSHGSAGAPLLVEPAQQRRRRSSPARPRRARARSPGTAARSAADSRRCRPAR